MPVCPSIRPSRPRFLRRGLLAWLLLAALPLLAQTPPAATPASEAEPVHLKVGFAVSAPFVMDNKGLLLGYSVDLWQEIATLNHWTFDQKIYPNIQAGLDAVAAHQCDVFVSDTSITSERLKNLDFSQPFFRTGFQIMVTNDRPHTLGWMIENLKKLLVLKIVWVSILVVLAVSALVTFFERKHNPTFPKAHHEGFAEAFYYVVSLALTGKSVYKGFPGTIGKMATIVWMIMGMLMVAVVTSSITSTMTVERLQGEINGPEDLPGKTIGVLTGTTGEIYARDHKLSYISYPNIKTAADALVASTIQGIVADAAILEYYDKSHPELPITEVGPFFNPVNYGFAVPKGDPRRYAIDESLELLVERGKLIQLGKEYLGSAYVP
jgi:polar amino acid transport system substrate-binding protein